MTDHPRRTVASDPVIEVARSPRRLPGAARRHAQTRPPARRRARRVVMLGVALVLPLALATNSLAATQITVKNPGGLTAAGPVNTETGFPAWYGDSNNLRLEPCLDQDNPLCGFLPGDVPDPNVPIAFPDNFPEEFFYQLVSGQLNLPGGGTATLTLGLEAAFANGAANPGDQVVFARTRVVVKGGTPNSTLTFKHPFGALTIDTNGTGAGRLVEDISPAVGNFTAALKGNFGPFLKWDPSISPAAPAGYVGDPGIAHKLVGGVGGYNGFSVTGGGLNVETTDLTASGKIATNTGVTGDYAVVNDGFLDIFATSKGEQLQVDGGTGYVTTPMTNDAGTERHYARIKLTGAKPTAVTVSNLGDKPVSTSVIKLADVAVTKATYDGTKLTVAATGDSYPLTVAGVGSLTDDQPTNFELAAPPASVTVKSATGAPVSYPVTITAGGATDPGLPPVAPQPSPGPVTDNTPDNPVGTPAAGPVAIVAPITTPVLRGATATLDGSASTGDAATYAWTQVGGPTVALSNPKAAKPTLTVPFFTTTTAAAPAAVPAKLTYQLVMTDKNGVASSPATVDVPVKNDTATVTAGARHRLGTELRIDGTSLIDGAAAVLTPATSVVIWNTTDATKPPVKLGVSPVDTLGAWTLRLKPGPTTQVTSVLVQSTRGGTATATLATR